MGKLTDRYMSARQAAEALRVGKGRVEQLIRAGVLRVEWVGELRLVERADVARYQRDRKPRGRPKKSTGK